MSYTSVNESPEFYQVALDHGVEETQDVTPAAPRPTGRRAIVYKACIVFAITHTAIMASTPLSTYHEAYPMVVAANITVLAGWIIAACLTYRFAEYLCDSRSLIPGCLLLYGVAIGCLPLLGFATLCRGGDAECFRADPLSIVCAIYSLIFAAVVLMVPIAFIISTFRTSCEMICSCRNKT